MKSSNSFTLGAIIGLVAVAAGFKLAGRPTQTPTTRKAKKEIKKVKAAYKKNGRVFVMSKVGQA